MKTQPLANLLAGPIQAAVRAESLAIQEVLDVLETLGVEKGNARMLRLRVEKTTEKRIVDEQTGQTRTVFQSQPVELAVPLLALIHPPSLRIGEFEVRFGINVLDLGSDTTPGGTSSPGQSVAMSRSVFTEPRENPSPMLSFTMKIVREPAEGMARLSDMLADLIQSKSATNPAIDTLDFISGNLITRLHESGIHTVREFLAATGTPSGSSALASKIDVKSEAVVAWRRQILKREEEP